MKKIGILSLYYKNPNCGAQLQALALCKVLEGLGYEPEEVCYNPNINHSIRQRLKYELREIGIIKLTILVIRKCFYKVRNYIIRNSKRAKQSNQTFEDFEKMVPHSDKVYTTNSIYDVINEYDVFVCGSDQIWNWSTTTFESMELYDESCTQPLDVYMLKFVPSGKRTIAYAASIACPFIPDHLKNYYEHNINRIDYVSIREKESLNLFDKETQCKITSVLDPTLLLSGDEWSQILSLENSKIYNKYIFCYFLNPSLADRKALLRISKILNMPIVTHPNINNDRFRSHDKGIADFEDYGMGPKEFLQYIKNADLVLTNSFHASVFSMQFHTPFYIFKRDSKVSMHSRLSSFVEEYHLEKRFLEYSFDDSDLEGYKEICWDFSDKQLNYNRIASYSWLKKALEE